MTLFPPDLLDTATQLLRDLEVRNLQLATAESCTGGLVAGLLTEVPGSSRVVVCGFVTYADETKSDLLGVDPVLIMAHGAVSRQVAVAMAEGALQHCEADIAVAVTGIAGPDGGTDAKPVGLVHFAVAMRNAETAAVERRFGNIGRTEVRMASVSQALSLIRSQIEKA